MSLFDVIGMGALNVDRIYAVPRFVTDGAESILATSVAAGGSSANTVCGLGKLGLRCGFVGAVGDDEDANIVFQSFADVGGDTSHIVIKAGHPTGVVLCLADGAGNRAMYVQPGANEALDDDDVDSSYLANARLIHLSSLAGDLPASIQIAAVRGVSQETKVSLSLDALYARRGLPALSDLIGRCAVLFANREELSRLTGTDVREAAQACLLTGCQTVVVTFGEGLRAKDWMGRFPAPADVDEKQSHKVLLACYIASGHEEWTVAALDTHKGERGSTIGAGDAFAAGFLWGFLSGWSLPRCGSLGHTAAGFSVTDMSPRAGLPTLDQLLAHYRWHYR